ncbi:unnamed protein product [Tuber melanosporum]|uniref:(Perigord truffle) hypothetical protein n=1 Tax=Tuber melanosporum (strain Mel28) TaxID=656061 RepID=D5GF14_TUBMM|nr:uncharacterized protein GSTUM_00006694001 [Tuber melanosporum]CAZ83107.1 unnamed protein product [Tuber melanosporum]
MALSTTIAKPTAIYNADTQRRKKKRKKYIIRSFRPSAEKKDKVPLSTPPPHFMFHILHFR